MRVRLRRLRNDPPSVDGFARAEARIEDPAIHVHLNDAAPQRVPVMQMDRREDGGTQRRNQVRLGGREIPVQAAGSNFLERPGDQEGGEVKPVRLIGQVKPLISEPEALVERQRLWPDHVVQGTAGSCIRTRWRSFHRFGQDDAPALARLQFIARENKDLGLAGKMKPMGPAGGLVLEGVGEERVVEVGLARWTDDGSQVTRGRTSVQGKSAERRLVEVGCDDRSHLLTYLLGGKDAGVKRIELCRGEAQERRGHPH